MDKVFVVLTEAVKYSSYSNHTCINTTIVVLRKRHWKAKNLLCNMTDTRQVSTEAWKAQISRSHFIDLVRKRYEQDTSISHLTRYYLFFTTIFEPSTLP